MRNATCRSRSLYIGSFDKPLLEWFTPLVDDVRAIPLKLSVRIVDDRIQLPDPFALRRDDLAKEITEKACREATSTSRLIKQLQTSVQV